MSHPSFHDITGERALLRNQVMFYFAFLFTTGKALALAFPCIKNSCDRYIDVNITAFGIRVRVKNELKCMKPFCLMRIIYHILQANQP